MSALGTPERPLRVAIVGSGPSGFYAADALMRSKIPCTMDMFDRLPAPFGLVRYGVAPDHPKIRTSIRIYERIAEDPRFAFFGNVMAGRDLSISELRQYYDAIILACGAETDRHMGIPGENLPGSHPATAFVGWYNGHPDQRHREYDLNQETAVIVGVGNVAMDLARILAKTVAELETTDIAQHALEALAKSKIKDIHVISRRGPAQVKFTLPELRELQELEDCDLIIHPEDLELDPVSEQELSDRNVRRIMESMRAHTAKASEGKSRRIHFRFLESPAEVKGNGRVQSVVLQKNVLAGEPFKLKAVGTDVKEELPCGLIFRSIGYLGVPVPGVPFHNSWGIIPNADGRVLDNETPVPGLYVAGWIKRGPTGVIGTNKPCSVTTVEKLLEDMPGLTPCPNPSTQAVQQLLAEKGVRAVDMDGWHKIDAEELARGEASGKPRERITSVEEMLEIAAG